MKRSKLESRIGLFDVLNLTFFTLFTFLCIFPIYYIFINSISDNDLSSHGLILFWPRGIHFDNYMRVLNIRGLDRAALISVGRTVIGTVTGVFATAFLGFALDRRELFARKFCYRFVIITMYFNAGIIPWYLNMRMLGLTNNLLAYVINLIAPFSLILYKTYIESLPASMAESAEIDGAGYLTLFLRIVIPLSMPIIATLCVFSAVSHWNSFIDTLYLMTDSKYYTLQYVLYVYLNQAQAIANAMRQSTESSGAVVALSKQLNPTSIRMTLAMVVVLPVLFIYPFFQQYFVKGIMIGAVKG